MKNLHNLHINDYEFLEKFANQSADKKKSN